MYNKKGDVMRICIDADACPVTNLAIKIANEFKLPCTLFCDTAHIMNRAGAETITVSKGADSVDFALVNYIQKEDIVITQDYGLAAMCLSRGARVLHQDGMEYTNDNIEALLLSRHESAKFRRAGGRTRGNKPRTAAQDEAFCKALRKMVTSF